MDSDHQELRGIDSLLRSVRRSLIQRGTTFAAWCRANKLDPRNAHHILRGPRDGPKARPARLKMARAAGLGAKFASHYNGVEIET